MDTTPTIDRRREISTQAAALLPGATVSSYAHADLIWRGEHFSVSSEDTPESMVQKAHARFRILDEAMRLLAGLTCDHKNGRHYLRYEDVPFCIGFDRYDCQICFTEDRVRRWYSTPEELVQTVKVRTRRVLGGRAEGTRKARRTQTGAQGAAGGGREAGG